MKPTTPAPLPQFAFRMQSNELLNIQGADQSVLGSMKADVEIQGKRQNMIVFFRTSPEKLKELQAKKFANANQETVGAVQNLLLMRGVPPEKIHAFLKCIAQEKAETARGEELIRSKHRAADDAQASPSTERSRQAARKDYADGRKRHVSSKALPTGLASKPSGAKSGKAVAVARPSPFRDADVLDMNSAISAIFKKSMGDKDNPGHLVLRIDENLKPSKFERTPDRQNLKGADTRTPANRPAKAAKPLPKPPPARAKTLAPPPQRATTTSAAPRSDPRADPQLPAQGMPDLPARPDH
ncbi:MAG: hypothetical protein RL404_1694 [Pseudomonadota bacterium]|jgi:murein DD-endopeptidase MepM/ murein hydrolase activator NlpD